ncbi:HD domain-containing protein [Candidatus Shapirobacteria bacterium]|nr:HD domain-containing protein [Candidatus Shapirobacteria bacterium]
MVKTDAPKKNKILPSFLPPEIKAIFEKFSQAGWEIYLVGGAVRDMLLGKKEINNWDFTTNACPEKIQSLFEESFYDNQYGTVKIPHPKFTPIEITTYRHEKGYRDFRHPDQIFWGKTIEEDLSRRDFTIDAIALGLVEPLPKAKDQRPTTKLIDPFGGQKDLEKKLIRAVGDPDERFAEDALRLLRAIRLATVLNFEIEEKTFNAIKKNAALIKKVSGERIREEIFKIIKSDQVEKGFNFLRETGLLEYLFPEFLPAYNLTQKGHHLWDVWRHSLLSAKFCPSGDPVVRLAALLHDIGKPQVVAEKDGERTFYNHEVVGARMARQIGQRLRLSNKDLDRLYRLVRWHQFSVSEKQTDKALKRFLRRVGLENVEDMLALRTGDRLGSGAKKTSWRTEEFKKRLIEVQKQPFSVTDLKINGHDVMKILDIPPGPKVGEVLNEIFAKVEEGKLENNRDVLLREIEKVK